MRHYHYRHYHRPFAFPWLLVGFGMLFLFGWKLFLIFPLMMILGGFWVFGGASRTYQVIPYAEDGYDKPKRKRQYQDDDDITYV